MSDKNKRANDDALEYGTRIILASLVQSRKICVITEADRSKTTVRLAIEY